jgi:hypothetical protein
MGLIRIPPPFPHISIEWCLIKHKNDFTFTPKYPIEIRCNVTSEHIGIYCKQSSCITVVLYGCETWSLTLREERRLRVSENRTLRRILGPKRDEVTVEWRKLYNEESNDLHCSHNIFRVMKSRRDGRGM